MNENIKEIIEKLKTTEPEGTSYPFWIIIDPRQNLETTTIQGLHNIASQITGVFFSRKDAEDFLKQTRYNFGEHAKVYCHSGHNSQEWRELFK